MRILVACEESQAVTIEGRAHGHEIYSLDEPSEDGERLVREFLQGLREESERRLDLLIKHLQDNYQDKAGP